ncbi:hypothetical protein GUITHDRAFT_42306, partial [Guillardia theta CCMP2712]
KGILPQAAWNGDKDAVDLLVACGAELHAVDRAGLSALMAASHRGHATVVQSLLRAQADIEQGLANGTTSLVLAAKFGHVKTVVKSLLDAKANLRACKANGWTPLHVAARMGHGGVVRTLVARNANVEGKNATGQTALMLS